MGVLINMVSGKVSRTVKIGVTGTSKIENEESVRESVRDILQKIDEKLCDTPYNVVVISPLARGADRIVADEIINFTGSKNHSGTFLEVILQEGSKKDESALFNKLIDFSKSTRTLDEILNEEVYNDLAEDYTHAGELVVDESDTIIAVWDQKEPEKGHTAEIVEYAMASLNISIFVIQPDGSKISEENVDVFMDDLDYHNIYNTESVKNEELEKAKEEKYELFDNLDLSENEKNLIKDNSITQMARANILAMDNQKWHYRTVNWLYYFAAAAVFIVAFQILFLPWLPQILIAEAGLMIVILILYSENKSREWHRKWIDYRYLAERLRAATIFSISGLDCRVSEHLPHQSSGDDWTLKAYQSIYQKQLDKPCQGLDFDSKKIFVLNEWIIHQKKYYKDKSEKHGTRDRRINSAMVWLFLIAAVGAVIHAIEVFFPIMGEIPIVPEFITLLVIFLPVLAASLAGIRVQHEYLRISKRYSQMAQYLNTVEHRIVKAENEKKLVKILDEANKMMLREHQDWRAIFSVRDTELP
jgi:hypothetical protein